MQFLVLARVSWYCSRMVVFKGSPCFLFASFRNSCLFKRHSLSNHFLFDNDLIRLRVLPALIFKQHLAVVIKMFSTFSRDSSVFSFNLSLAI